MIEKLQPNDVTPKILKDTAALFSSSYGIWGPLAAEKIGKFCKPGMASHSGFLAVFERLRDLVMHMHADEIHRSACEDVSGAAARAVHGT